MRERARRWAHARQGPDPEQLTLASRRIYLLPTASGLLYAVMLATMLAGSMNYNNNLAFTLTFLLAGVGIVSIYHTHRTLSGLRLHYLGAAPAFAGDRLEVRLVLTNDSRRPREEIVLEWTGAAEISAGLPPMASRTVALPVQTTRRGPLTLPPLRLATHAPLGLVRAWAWVHLESRPLVYPRPAERAGPLRPAAAVPAAGLEQRGGDDFAGLRAYLPGDSPRHIAWRSYARSGELLVREYRGASSEEPLWIEWDALPDSGVEERIARLARLVIDAYLDGRRWGLRVPGTSIGPAEGREHLHRSLRRLAVTALPEGVRR